MSKLWIGVLLGMLVLNFSWVDVQAIVIKDDFVVNDDTTEGNHNDPTVGLNNDGKALIVWEDSRNASCNIYGQHYNESGVATDSNLKVSTQSGNTIEYNPSIAVEQDGSFLVVWRTGYAQRYSADGIIQDSTFQLFSSDIKYYVDIAIDTTGTIIMVWRRNVSGSGYEIFMQRFNSSGDSLGPKIIVNDDETSESQNNPNIALDGRGKFMVVWEDERNGTNNEIYGQLFDETGAPVDSNFLINDTTGSFSHKKPSVATDFAGRFLVTWNDNRNGNDKIYGQFYDNTGTPVNNNFLINDDEGSSGKYSSSCAMDSAGNAVVVWYDGRTGGYHIHCQRFTSTGDTIGSNFQVDENLGSENSHKPKVYMNKGGEFIVVWDNDIENNSIYARRYDATGNPYGIEFKVNDNMGTKNQQFPAVDMNQIGNTVVVWSDYRTPTGIYGQRLDNDGNLIDVNFLITDNGYYPDVAVSNSNNFVVVWRYSSSIYLQRFNASGDTINGIIKISDSTGNHQRHYPSIGMNDTSSFVVAWQDYRNGSYEIYAQRFTPEGDTIGINFKANDTTISCYAPSVAISSSGRFLITWRDVRNGNNDIYAQLYDTDGSMVDSNFKVNTTDGSSNQLNPSVASNTSSKFIVVWEDYNSPRGIYGQWYDTTGTPIDSNFKISESTSAYKPEVACDSAGKTVVTWYDNRDGNNNIYAQRYNADHSPNGENYKVSNEVEGLNPGQYHPDVTTNGNRICYVWYDARQQKGYDIIGKVTDWEFVSIEEIANYKLQNAKLEIHPNPIIQSMSISYYLPTKATVSLKIYDVSGRIVKTLINEEKTAGNYNVSFDAKKLATGIYFAKFKTGDCKITKKILLIK